MMNFEASALGGHVNSIMHFDMAKSIVGGDYKVNAPEPIKRDGPIFEGRKFDFSVPDSPNKLSTSPKYNATGSPVIPFKGKNYMKYRKKFDQDFDRRHQNGKHIMYGKQIEETKEPSGEIS
jgi:hypothetical protein